MQEIRSSNSPVITGIFDPNKFRARHYRSMKFDSKLKYLILNLKLMIQSGELSTQICLSKFTPKVDQEKY